MLSENIKKFRLKQNLTQEKLAISINVVRQTVSKWENNLSVPDADQLIELSKFLNVSVNELLDITAKDPIAYKDIAKELEKVDMELAQLSKQYRLEKKALKVRGLILFLVISAILISIISKSVLFSTIAFAVISIVSLVILYRNVEILTVVTSPNADLKLIKIVTAFNIIVIIGLFLFVGLMEIGVITITEKVENFMGIAIVSAIIIFSGIISPRLPFNKHTGLRLPWTIYDEETWNLAHRVLGITSLPITIVYISLSIFVSDISTLSLCIILAWIGIPAIISLLFYMKKVKL